MVLHDDEARRTLLSIATTYEMIARQSAPQGTRHPSVNSWGNAAQHIWVA